MLYWKDEQSCDAALCVCYYYWPSSHLSLDLFADLALKYVNSCFDYNSSYFRRNRHRGSLQAIFQSRLRPDSVSPSPPATN